MFVCVYNNNNNNKQTFQRRTINEMYWCCVILLLFKLRSAFLPSLPLGECRRYCDVWRHAVCVSAALVSAAKVMCCIQCSVVDFVAWQASAYARCIMAKESVKKDDCSPEFRKFFSCFQKAVRFCTSWLAIVVMSQYYNTTLWANKGDTKVLS